jgi:uncharacterized membrane protein HdeD (DUF308 family)
MIFLVFNLLGWWFKGKPFFSWWWFILIGILEILLSAIILAITKELMNRE